jgi:hypothetical protein
MQVNADTCPKGLKVDMTTLWIADAVFILFIMPIWLRINRSLKEYAEESLEDH